MKKLLTILLFAFALVSCHRGAIPSVSTNSFDSTFIERKDSSVVKDTTIIVAAKQASLATAIDSLLKIIAELRDENRDTTITVPYVRSQDTASTPIVASMYIGRDGSIRFMCKEDSLKLVIRNMTRDYLELFISKQKVKETTVLVPGPVQIETKLPKWFWYLLGFNLIYFGLKITSVFYAPTSGILKLLLTAVKKI